MDQRPDPWQEVRTFHDLAADEVISALQKEIRRGHAENASLLAYEMILTGTALEEKLWSRLLVISVEDIGFADPHAAILIKALFDMHLLYTAEEQDRYLFATHAVRYLCECEKDRSNDELLNLLMKTDEKPDIPDYALDMHTRKGQAMGRGLTHFLMEGSKIFPEKNDRDKQYREKLLQLVDLDDLDG